uniref:Guanylate cyclase domain-containing protein n=1 Tax=Neobodo designis TaxID=312471 RepID=A0A7S1PW78_NEODS|mmetsp:Transcript_22055/g.68468  ORF Transcript_22055/g.68468 Transcript_22055/m.68468 type:complete len:969 (+) Transcript_22055:199-3105(+)
MRAPLRLVISAVAAVCVAVVAALTLSITLTSSLAALRAVGLGQAEALLQAAQVSSDNLFAVPQRATDTLQNTSRSAEWPWLANDANARGQWLRTGETLLANSGGQLYSLIVYFRDNTILLNGFAFSAAEPFVRPAPYIGSITVYGSAVNATDPEATPNQSPMPTQYTLQHVGNRSDVAPSHPDYAHALPRIEFAHFVNTSFWSYNMIRGTRNARLSVNAGTTAMAMYGAVRGFYAFVAPMHTRGDVPGRDPPFGFASAALAIEDLNAFMRRIKATRGTLAVAMDGFGYLLASSSDDSFQSTTRVPDGARPRHLGCAMTRDTGIVTVDEDSFEFCRAHASEYGNPALAKVVDDRALAFSRSPAVVLKSLDGEGKHFVGVAPVAIRYLGPTVHLILLVPETDIIGDVVQSRNVAIGVTCAAFVLVAAAAFAAITLLLAPLGTIAERMRRAADFDDDGGDESVSAMAEVAALQEAYYEMNEELNRIRSFVPQSVLMAKKQAAENDDEAEDEEPDDDGTNVLSDHGGHSVASHRTGNSLSRPTSAGSHNPNTSSSAHPVSAHTAPLSPMPGSELSKTSGQLRASIDDDARSCASGARSTRSHRVAGARRGGAVLATATLLKQRVVTVLVANLCGFLPQLANTFSLASAVANVSDTVDFVYRTVSRHGGVVASYHGDHFVATFNAVKSCGSHALSAAKVGTLLTDGSDGVGFGAALRVGIATGKCHVGNLGNKEVKAFSTVGPAYQHASVLERMGRLYGEADERSVLATRRTCADIATMFRFRFVDVVALPGRDRGAGATITPIATLLGLPNRGSNFAHDENGDDDEWLYVVGDEDSSDPNARWNEAFSLLMADEVSAAQTMVQPYRDATLGSVSVSEKLTVDVAPSDPPGTVVPEIRVSVAPATPEEAPVSANQRNSAAEGVHSTGPKHPLRTRREAPNGQDIVRFDRLCDRQSSARHRDLGEFYDAAFSIR